MAPEFLIAEIAFAAGVLFVVAKSCWSRGISKYWVFIYCLASAVGIGVGLWFACVSYQPAERVIVYSFPVPGAFHVLERYRDGTEQWVDFITAPPNLAVVGNTCFFLALRSAVAWWANQAKLKRDERRREVKDVA